MFVMHGIHFLDSALHKKFHLEKSMFFMHEDPSYGQCTRQMLPSSRVREAKRRWLPRGTICKKVVKRRKLTNRRPWESYRKAAIYEETTKVNAEKAGKKAKAGKEAGKKAEKDCEKTS